MQETGAGARGGSPPKRPDPRLLAVVLSAAAVIVAGVVLCGWLVEQRALVVLGFESASMKPQTALAVIALGGGVLGRWVSGRAWTLRTGAVFALALGTVALVETAVRAGSGWDEWLADDPWSNAHPGRMSVPTAVSLVLLSGAGLLFTVARPWARRASPWLVAAGLGPAILTFLGMAFDGPSLYGLFLELRGVSVPTALTLVALGVALLLDHPDIPFTHMVTGTVPEAAVFRRVLLASLVPVTVGVLLYQVVAPASHWRPGTVLGLVSGLTVVLLAGVAWVTAGEVARDRAALREARNEASQASRAKTEFLSRMSHELRTPLNAILGFGQLLQIREGTDESEEVGHILRGGRHLLALTDEILDIARIEEGRLEVSREPLRLSEVVVAAVDLAVPTTDDAGSVDVRYEVDPKLWVTADRRRLVQVLVNLLTNAIKYGGHEVSVVVSAQQNQAETVHVAVSDDGPGIDPTRHATLFEPFERLGAETSVVPGTGLGLALSRGLARLMDGDLTVTSQPGRGSTFVVHLPAVAAPPADTLGSGDAEPAAARPPHTQPSAVLQVEDNPANLELVESAISRLFPRTRVVSTMHGAAAVELARAHRPDLVLLDVHLPDLSAEEVIRALRRDAVTAAVPVVIVTADATRETRERLLAAGAYDLLTKPLDLDRLRTLIENLGRPGAEPPSRKS